MIRCATVPDAASIAGIHVDAWRAAYAGIVPAAHLAGLSKERRAEGWRQNISADPGSVLLAETDGQATGWVSLGRGRDADAPPQGEVYALYVRPDRWRCGLGRTLLAAAEEELRRRGCTHAVLWVLERNLPARAFYERSGYRPDGMQKDISLGGADLRELRYGKDVPPHT